MSKMSTTTEAELPEQEPTATGKETKGGNLGEPKSPTEPKTPASTKSGPVRGRRAEATASEVNPLGQQVSSLLKQPIALATMLGFGAFILYSVFSVLQWNSYAIKSWDLGIFTQLAKAYSNFETPIVPIKGEGYNLLGDHFHPLLVLLGPIYKFFPSAYTLLVVQNALFAFSVGLIALLAIRRLGRLPGLLFGFAYAISWGLQSAIDAQFHEIAFAVPLLALSLCALIEEKWRQAWIWAALLVFVKEDLGLTVFMIGLVMTLRTRRPAGLWLAAWGVVWFVLATRVILPSMNPADSWAYSSQLDIGGALGNPDSLFQVDKVSTVVVLIAITATLCLYSPICAVVLPTLAWRFLSDLEPYWGQQWQYSAVLMPVVFCAAIDALSRRKVLESARIRLLSGIAVALIAIALSSQYAFAKLDDPTANFSTANNASNQAALAAVPPGVSVETDISLMSYLADTRVVYWVGNKNPAPEYVLMDVSSRGQVASDVVASEAQTRFPGNSYTTVFADGRFQVAKRTN